jgi:hypothetical protein
MILIRRACMVSSAGAALAMLFIAANLEAYRQAIGLADYGQECPMNALTRVAGVVGSLAILMAFLALGTGLAILGHAISRKGGRAWRSGGIGVAIGLTVLLAIFVARPYRGHRGPAGASNGAVVNMRLISRAATAYLATHGKAAPSLTELNAARDRTDDSSWQQGLWKRLESGSALGYLFEYRPIRMNADGGYTGFEIRANPEAPGLTGLGYFFSNSDGLEHFEPCHQAGPSSSPLR